MRWKQNQGPRATYQNLFKLFTNANHWDGAKAVLECVIPIANMP